MKIIYDAEKALQRKKEIEAAVDLNNSKVRKENNKISNIALCALIFACFLVSIGGWALYRFYLSPLSATPLAFYILGLLSVLGVLVCIITFSAEQSSNDDYKTYREEYTADVLYYVATQGKNVLDTQVQTHNDNGNMSIYCVLEDEDGIVTEQQVCMVTCKHSTAVTENTLDLSRGVYFIPYKKSKAN